MSLPFAISSPRKFNYNCGSIQAEVFPIKKVERNFGQQSYQLKGHEYEQLVKNIPNYQKKVTQTQLEVEKTISDNPDKAMQQYVDFRTSLFARDELDNFSENIEESFKEKMRLLSFKARFHDLVLRAYTFLDVESPISWLDSSYTMYINFISFGLSTNYVKANRRRRTRKVSTPRDHCSELSQSLRRDTGWGKGVAKDAHSLVYRCYDIFPYDLKAADKIFDLTLLMIDFYVFSNFTSNGLGANNLFQKIKEQQLSFDSNLRFHEFMATTLNNMNDAHISYKTECFDQFTFVQPLYLQDINDFDSVGLRITKANSPELQKWLNYKVLQIDGLGAASAISNFANGLGKSHSLITRYTLGYSRIYYDSPSEDFRLDRGLYLKRPTVPYRSYIVYTLQNPDTGLYVEVKVDWLVFTNPTLVNFNDQYNYWKRNCEAQPFIKVEKKATTSLQRRTTGDLKLYSRPIRKRSKPKKILEKRQTYRETSEGTIPFATGPGFAFFTLTHPNEGKFGVLVIQSFDVTDMDSWFTNMRKGFLTLIDKRIKRLLLDLTGNSGGVLCLAYSLLGVLSPSPTFPYPATEFSYGTRAVPTQNMMKVSKCVDEAGLKVSPFKLQCFKSLETRADFPSGTDWGSEGEVKAKVVNGFISGYTKFSPFLMDKCTMKQSSILAEVKPDFEAIIVMSDGLCGSSCAIVASYLHQHKSPGLILSTTRGAPVPNIYSFAGGQVVNLNNIKDIAKRSICYDIVPNALERVQMTITYRGIFNMADKRNPLEYYIIPANFVIDYTPTLVNSFKERWLAFFAQGIEIWQNPEQYSWDSSETGKIIAYST